jgi:uncharacterized 2Fe-2S/4Fe-4S cluster protein (DUF4445 family)
LTQDKIKIKFISPSREEHSVWVFRGKKLWDCFADSGLDSGGVCGGNGTCGKCKVRVEGDAGPISNQEREYLLPEEIREGWRLACYCRADKPLVVYADLGGKEINSKEFPYRKEEVEEPALLQCRQFFIPGMDREKPISLYKRLINALGNTKLELNIRNLSALSKWDRIGRPALEFNALIYPENRVKYIIPRENRVFGAAIDIGTTTIFTALIDMKTKEVGAVNSVSNLQRSYGADIISRISYALENREGIKTLQQVLINSINTSLEELAKELSIKTEDIYIFTIAGNPAIIHFLLGLNTSGFAEAPYIGIFQEQMVCRAKDIGLICANEAECYILPQLGGFVGADITAGLLLMPENKEQTYILVDIGTNGEVVLHHQGSMWVASAAAGPAFEGGGISCGMRAGIGVVDRVFTDSEGQLKYNVIGGSKPRGLCGTAVLDVIALLFANGFIDKNGIVNRDRCEEMKMLGLECQGDQITLIPGKDTATGLNIFINQEDVRQIQLAKAAIRAAIEVLLMEAKVEYKHIHNIYLAGSFGNYINPASAVKIGLLPDIAISKIISLGNAAGRGITQALLAQSLWAKATRLSTQVKHIELAEQPDFQDIFLKQLNL